MGSKYHIGHDRNNCGKNESQIWQRYSALLFKRWRLYVFGESKLFSPFDDSRCRMPDAGNNHQLYHVESLCHIKLCAEGVFCSSIMSVSRY